MRMLLKTALAIGFAMVPVMAQANVIDGKNNLVCAVFQWKECTANSDCVNVSSEEIRAVRFINVDFKGKKLSSRDPDDDRTTDIRQREIRDSQVVLQGLEYAVAWTMTIDKRDGEMTFSGARENVVFNGFGYCTVD